MSASKPTSPCMPRSTTLRRRRPLISESTGNRLKSPVGLSRRRTARFEHEVDRPVGCNAGGHHRADAGAAHAVDLDAALAQRAVHAQVGEAARAAAGQHQADRRAALDARQARHVALDAGAHVHMVGYRSARQPLPRAARRDGVRRMQQYEDLRRFGARRALHQAVASRSRAAPALASHRRAATARRNGGWCGWSRRSVRRRRPAVRSRARPRSRRAAMRCGDCRGARRCRVVFVRRDVFAAELALDAGGIDNARRGRSSVQLRRELSGKPGEVDPVADRQHADRDRLSSSETWRSVCRRPMICRVSATDSAGCSRADGRSRPSPAARAPSRGSRPRVADRGSPVYRLISPTICPRDISRTRRRMPSSSSM